MNRVGQFALNELSEADNLVCNNRYTYTEAHKNQIHIPTRRLLYLIDSPRRMEELKIFVTVALFIQLRRCFDYQLPDTVDQAYPGQRALVPFGKNKQLVGIIIDVKESTDIPADKLKKVISVLEPEPCLPNQLMQLLSWSASYYAHPIGQCLSWALPTLVKKGKPLNPPESQVVSWHSDQANFLQSLESKKSKLGTKQLAFLNWLKLSDSFATASEGSMPLSQIQQQGFTAQLKSFVAKGWLSKHIAQVPWETYLPKAHGTKQAPMLSDAQQACVEQILQSATCFRSHLLFGITGSGKTQVYISAILELIQTHSMPIQILVLVPEIGLTPQTVARFQEQLPLPVLSWHSQINDNERFIIWNQCRSNQSFIVIGTRSSIFLPMPHLALIIVDEEHDLSFKQQDSWRYHARDLAVKRAQNHQISVVLGSATPSLESLFQVKIGRYQQILLTERPQNSKLPQLALIDLKGEPLHHGLSGHMIAHIEQALAQNNQVLVFINRRGFAPSLLCHQCGWRGQCDHCDALLALHLGQGVLKCHHCDISIPIPPQCPDCSSTELIPIGVGTERTELALEMRFQNYPVIRIDRDSTRKKDAFQQLLKPVHDGQPCILIGTQMLAKGHHFPNVTLVAIPDADNRLFSSDFRALERMGQLITQVAGRAGRSNRAGTVLIQTHQPEHPVFQFLATHNYQGLSEQLLAQRQANQMPPYSRLSIIRAESENPTTAEHLLSQVALFLTHHCHSQDETQPAQAQESKLTHLGPMPQTMEKKQGKFRYQLWLRSCDTKHLVQSLHGVAYFLTQNVSDRTVRWSIDMDAQEV